MHRFLSPGHKDYESEVKKKRNSPKPAFCPNATEGQNRCPSCNRLFRCQLLWNLHIKNHDARHAYQLNIQSIQHDGNYAVHVKKHIADKRYVCRHCFIRFVHFSSLRCHCVSYHASKNSRASELRVCVQRKNLTSAKNHREIRNFRDCRKSHFRQGGNIHSREYQSRSLVRRTRQSRSAKDENEDILGAKYACTFCTDSFRYKSALKLHLLKHTGEKPYQCNVCGKRFRRKSRCEGHVRNHTGDKPYECKECGQRFAQSGNLYYHVRTRHAAKKSLPKEDTKQRKSNIKDSVQENNLQEGSRTHSQLTKQGPDDASEIQSIEITKDGAIIGLDKKERTSDDEGLGGRNSERTSEFEGHLDDRPFSCEFCDASFRQKSILVIHRRRHTGEKPLECDECGVRFLQHSTLRYHKRTRHTTEQPCVCTYCGKEFARSILLEYHVRKHTGGRPFACLRCSETFASLAKYEEHVKKHPRDTGSDAGLTSALENFRKARDVDAGENSAETKPQPSSRPDSSRPFACEFCDATFRQKSILVNHRRRHTGEKPYECQECKMRFKQHSALTYHRKTRHADEPGPSVCTYCNKQFSKSILLEYHLRKHTGGRPFACSLCCEMFTNMTKLTEHRKRHHAKPGSDDPSSVVTCVPDPSKHLRKHTCAICARTFQSKADLQRHGAVHSSEKPFMCTHCGTCFRLKASLEAHTRRHTGEKPYHCTDCGMQFRQQSTLKYHVRAQHTGEKPFLCLECGKTFRSSTMLKYHTRTHTGEKPFACDVCGSRFARPGQFRQHKKLHSSALTYACDDCGKKFRLQTTFAKHRKIHLAQKTNS